MNVFPVLNSCNKPQSQQTELLSLPIWSEPSRLRYRLLKIKPRFDVNGCCCTLTYYDWLCEIRELGRTKRGDKITKGTNDDHQKGPQEYGIRVLCYKDSVPWKRTIIIRHIGSLVIEGSFTGLEEQVNKQHEQHVSCVIYNFFCFHGCLEIFF